MFRVIKIFSYNHIYDFSHKYFRTFECQINRYERIKEQMNANHKYETRVKPKIYTELKKKKKKKIGKSIFCCNVRKKFVSDISLFPAKLLQRVSELSILK